MRTKIIFIGLIVTSLAAGSYFYHQYEYVKTLMLSEIVGKTDDSLVNIAVSLFDFDTELTRNDINQLKNSKEYWISRIQEVDAIEDTDLKTQASTQLLSDMMEDPVLNKICSGILTLGTNASFGLIGMIL